LIGGKVDRRIGTRRRDERFESVRGCLKDDLKNFVSHTLGGVGEGLGRSCPRERQVERV